VYISHTNRENKSSVNSEGVVKHYYLNERFGTPRCELAVVLMFILFTGSVPDHFSTLHVDLHTGDLRIPKAHSRNIWRAVWNNILIVFRFLYESLQEENFIKCLKLSRTENVTI
jgi:hypothetical protein